MSTENKKSSTKGDKSRSFQINEALKKSLTNFQGKPTSKPITPQPIKITQEKEEKT